LAGVALTAWVLQLLHHTRLEHLVRRGDARSKARCR
jgi:hypothetical protein